MTSPRARRSAQITSDSELLKAAHARGLPIDNSAALRQALTHKSLVPDALLESNERLEFLGDSILGLVISEYLYATFPDRREGPLAKAKALIVCKPALAGAARRLDLASLIRLGVAEEAMGGRDRESIAADAFEALVAVIHQSGGYNAARDFVLGSLAPEIAAVHEAGDWRDKKTVLQELRHAAKQTPPVYRVIHEEGMPHDRTFTVEVVLDGEVLGVGSGKSKRIAEQAAADAALMKISGY